MGRLIDGRWTSDELKTDGHGRFLREQTLFKCEITRDGGSGFKAEAGRYHLYVSLACPWAHRTLIARKLKGLEDVISVSIVDPVIEDRGWRFSDAPGATPDDVNGKAFLHEIYVLANPRYSGRVTVPALWDKRERTIACNDSRKILRSFDCEFDELARNPVSFCPPHLKAQVDAALDAMYEPFNNGVYRAGFSTTQQAYEEAVVQVFDALNTYEKLLGTQRYLCGSELTEADICLYTTLVRFDPVYHYHFKCNLAKVADYPNVSNYLRELYQIPAFRSTTDFEHIKRHYYSSHPAINPTRIVPSGPRIDLNGPHDRARFS